MTFVFGELVRTSSAENALFLRTLPPKAMTASPSVSLGNVWSCQFRLRASRLVRAASAGTSSTSSQKWNAARSGRAALRLDRSPHRKSPPSRHTREQGAGPLRVRKSASIFHPAQHRPPTFLRHIAWTKCADSSVFRCWLLRWQTGSFGGRVVIPIHNEYGELVAYSGSRHRRSGAQIPPFPQASANLMCCSIFTEPSNRATTRSSSWKASSTLSKLIRPGITTWPLSWARSCPTAKPN